MNFEFTDEQKDFRDQVKEFLAGEVPQEQQEVFGVDSEEQ